MYLGHLGLDPLPEYGIPGYYSTGGANQPATPPPIVANQPTQPIPSAAPWYKTWWGVGLIGAVAFVGYRRFVKK